MKASLKALATDFINWIFFDNEKFLKVEHQSVLQRLALKYSHEFYQELAYVLLEKIQVYYEEKLIFQKDFDHKANHHVMMLLSLLPYCDFDNIEAIEIPLWSEHKSKWQLKAFQLRFLNLGKYIFHDPKRALLLSPVHPDQKDKKDTYLLIFMGTHPLPTSPGWQVGICADSSPFMNFGELILSVFEKEIFEVIDLIVHAKKADLICTGHSLGGALSLLLFQKKPEITKVYALNPPRFINPPKKINAKDAQCTVYVQKGDFLQQVGMMWPHWTKVVVLDLPVSSGQKIWPIMAHCRCYSAHQGCTITEPKGDPYQSHLSYSLRYLTTSLWQILTLPLFILHALWLVVYHLLRELFHKANIFKSP